MAFAKSSLENMVTLFGSHYLNKTVLITGNTGFKGSWMAHWLIKMGANVIGFSRDIPSDPNHFYLLQDKYFNLIEGDVTDFSHLHDVISKYNVDIIFHLAAQSLVRYSYQNSLETFGTNVMGTANIIEASRKEKSVKGIIIVTSDKCYENYEDDRAFKETDRMGGHDPYSASKGCAELVVSSYRNSFFPVQDFGKTHHLMIASGRAGNVIGGGDWSKDRLIPDIVKNTSIGISTEIRNPSAVRPWQHVLEPVSGYLLLGQKMLEGDCMVSDAWNFGPLNNETLTVKEILEKIIQIWPSATFEKTNQINLPHEAKLLQLDCTKANNLLNWYPVWNTEEAITKTILWYRSFYDEGTIQTDQDLTSFISQAKKLNYSWTK